jgi:cyclopropane-fatty-acyl-phospholipid synthase
LFVHIFTHREQSYLFEDHGPQDWMTRYFFSGGMMPSDSLLLHYQRDLTLTDHWRWSGRHYAQTCNAWLSLADQNKADVLEQMAAAYGREQALLWRQRWRIFFMACAELFAYRNGNEWGVSHYLFERRS